MKQINGRALELRGLLLENRVRAEIAAAGTLVRCAARQRVLIGRCKNDFALLCASMRGVAAESGRSWVSKRALLESQLPALQNGKRVLSDAAAELLAINAAIETAAGKIAALDGLQKRIAGLTRQQEIARLTRADFLSAEELAEIKGGPCQACAGEKERLLVGPSFRITVFLSAWAPGSIQPAGQNHCAPSNRAQKKRRKELMSRRMRGALRRRFRFRLPGVGVLEVRATTAPAILPGRQTRQKRGPREPAGVWR